MRALLHFDVGNSHRVVRVSHSSPLAFRVDVGNRLVSIRAPGRSLFVCGPNTYGHDIVRELQAAAAGPGRVLSFAVARAARPAPTGGTREVRAPSGPLMGVETVPEPEGRLSEGHSSPPSHAFPDARSFAGCFCTIFPCIPFAPLACENIIPHDSNSYQSKGVVILMFGYIPIPFCWDDHLARKHGNTFEVTTGCCQGTTDTWTSADGFHTSSSCCPAFRCG